MNFEKHHLVIYFAVSILIFAVIYTYIDRTSDESHFRGIEDKDSFLDKLYFSTATQATIGAGDITPRSRTSRMLFIIQAVITIVIFAYVASYVARRWGTEPMFP